jgi:radical SAM protein with 4Fe4S-binding SPASM domain
MDLKLALRRLLALEPQREERFLAPGLYHFFREERDGVTRFHLRAEPDGRATLLVNAAAIYRLSPPGAWIAHGLLAGKDETQIVRRVLGHFRGANRQEVMADLERVAALLASARSSGEQPVVDLDDPSLSPYEVDLVAPLEADLPLAGPETMRPLIDALWRAAIPHATFLFGEDSSADDLLAAVEHAGDLGLIAGVRGRASDLAADGSLDRLAQAGVDHVTVPYAAAEAELHDSLLGKGDHARAIALLATIRSLDVAAVAEIPLVASTAERLEQTVAALQSADVANFTFYAIAASDDGSRERLAGVLEANALPQVAGRIEDLAARRNVRFLWLPPVLADPQLSLAAHVRAGPRSWGDVAVRVEPDGRVIPPRGPYRSAGNLLTDAWEDIWNDGAFLRYRARLKRPTRCLECPDLAVCAADCPRNPAGWAVTPGAQLHHGLPNT